MAVNSAQLLKLLEPPVRPVGTGASTGAFRAPFEAQGFSALLDQAAKGELASDVQVAVGDSWGAEMSSEAQKRLSVAADSAQAMGARKAVVLMDGRSLMLDVASRTIEGECSADGIRGQRVDAVINANEQQAQKAASGSQLLDHLGKSAIGVRTRLIQDQG